MEKGNLSIDSQNILPIIKKWLYSDIDIFLRELVSNGCDAITKLKKLKEMGEAEHIPDDEVYKVTVSVNENNKTIKITDNGIGMTADEIKQYINQIAFSGANDFIEKYKDRIESDTENEIIGHFGLGFYSAFMVADTVEIISLSYRENSEGAKWISDGGIEYEMDKSDKSDRGTEITLHVSEDSKDFLSIFKLNQILDKYCSFMPIEIYLVDECKKSEEDTPAPSPVNDTEPLWLKPASKVTDEEYKAFYHKVFTDFNDPLFWIHLNMDYPFKLKGILYFPKLKHDLQTIEGQIKLYCNQVFVADNVKEVVPEFLLLLKGALDCPEIPLNVSRSFLQNDVNVAKMSGYITRKVADKLNSIFKKDRDAYESYWENISPFVKYGCIRDKSFYDKVKDACIFKTIYDKYVTLDEYLENNKDKNENKVFYVTDPQQQSQYIKMFKDEAMDAVLLNTTLDNPYISYLEMYTDNVSFQRIDSDISESLKSESGLEDSEKESLTQLFKDIIDADHINIQVEALKSQSVPAIILLSEQSRRMQEMSTMFQGSAMPPMPGGETLILNAGNSLVKKLTELKNDENKKEDINLICSHIFDLALMTHKPLDNDEMTAFVERSTKMLEILAGK